VALRAVRSHFPLVNVGVTILAGFSDVAENRLGVALDAGHLFVHSAERILGLVVIKFRNWPDGPPTCCRVAILTGYGKGAVRTSGSHTLSEGRRNRSQLPDNQQKPNPSFDHSKRTCPFPQFSQSGGGSSAGLTLMFPQGKRRNNCTEGQLMAMFSDN